MCLHEDRYPTQQVLGQALWGHPFSSGLVHSPGTALPSDAKGCISVIITTSKRGAAWPCLQMPTIPASKAGTTPFPPFSLLFYTALSFVYLPSLCWYLLALGLEVQTGDRASRSVLMNLNLHHPAALEANVMPSGRC